MDIIILYYCTVPVVVVVMIWGWAAVIEDIYQLTDMRGFTSNENK